MTPIIEAHWILRKHRIPCEPVSAQGGSVLFKKHEVDMNHLRRLGFRISRLINGMLIVNYKGRRFGIIV